MNLYLVPNDPEHTTLVSANGVGLYQVTTRKPGLLGGSEVLLIRRPAECERESIVAEVEWQSLRFGKRGVVRSNIFDGKSQDLRVRDFLYRLGSRFSYTRYFLGSDDEEYCWKIVSGIGPVLTNTGTGTEVARFTRDFVREGFFRGERKWFLQIQPTTLDVDMVVMTFIIMEKRRRDRVEDHMMVIGDRDEDVCEGGTSDAGGLAG